ncbi:hypothetical protein F441_00694 [Phytophthora nicotianae CJ01A1]|uniref:Uncharacterized protein n=4 Tax=Phytophthora nicotianae TaxID=4792 RepID=W2PCD0_PHYN3|nr:hypothetical protein PPTG_19972 [Phytophthora nicotianae INRA-310]ETM97868.1 hypothetical protein PPTG_19972 [Phytophthora nicotianae INRA-310]ETP26696.1 hypothetical protein F441_00694 [Phytophthora nicotianae CJ01A1]ETP54688.1 hypothetical protein F442_00664 [Phytophthora nicotianae P10297]
MDLVCFHYAAARPARSRPSCCPTDALPLFILPPFCVRVQVQEVAMTVSLASEVMPEAAVVVLAVAAALDNTTSSLAMVELILVDLWLVTAADVVVVTVVAVDEMLVVVVVEAVVVALHREVETNVNVNRTILETHVTNLELLESTPLPLD